MKGRKGPKVYFPERIYSNGFDAINKRKLVK